MGYSKLIRELYFTAPDKKGTFAQVCGALANAGVNIIAMCAYGQGGVGYFMMVTSDNLKAIDALKELGLKPKENDALLVELNDKPGAAAKVGKKIADAGINIRYAYGSTPKKGGPALMVISCNKPEEAIEALI